MTGRRFPNKKNTIITVINAPHWGGLHVLVERISPFYSENNYSRIVICNCDEQTKRRFEGAGCHVVSRPLTRIRKKFNLLGLLKYPRAFVADVRAIGAVIRKSPNPILEGVGLLNFQPIVAALVYRTPLVFQLHSNLAPPLLRHVFGFLGARIADVLMTSGKGMIASHGGISEKWDTIVPFYAPIDSSQFKPDAHVRRSIRAKLNVSDDEILVGTVGNRGWQKRHEWIVKLAKIFKNSDFRFAIIGNDVDSQMDYYRKAVIDPITAMGLRDRVILSQQDFPVEQYMNAFDVFILPSRSEGASFVTAEAMSTGLPIIASDVGSLSDMVDESCGILCDVDSFETFETAVRSLGDPNRRKEMGSAARERVLEKLSPWHCAAAHFEAYNTILE